MSLAAKRVLFTTLLSEFIVWANGEGYQVALDQVKRTQAEASANAASGKGIRNSLHLVGLAADLNLYIKGVYQTATTSHAPLGAKWKSMHPLARWGGDFSKPDGNHYSLEHEGVK